VAATCDRVGRLRGPPPLSRGQRLSIDRAPMALSLDSIVTDLMFQSSAAIDQKTLIEGLGGETALETKQLLDVDRLDPRAEMELSPSMPFRRRGERRLMIIDDQGVTPRPDPQADPVIKTDLRPAKESLIGTAQKLPLRL